MRSVVSCFSSGRSGSPRAAVQFVLARFTRVTEPRGRRQQPGAVASAVPGGGRLVRSCLASDKDSLCVHAWLASPACLFACLLVFGSDPETERAAEL